MNVQVYTGIPPNFETLITFDFHCPKCGSKFRMPADTIIQRTACDADYFKSANATFNQRATAMCKVKGIEL